MILWTQLPIIDHADIRRTLKMRVCEQSHWMTVKLNYQVPVTQLQIDDILKYIVWHHGNKFFFIAFKNKKSDSLEHILYYL